MTCWPRPRPRAAGLGSIDDVRTAGRQLAGFSAGMAPQERAAEALPLRAHVRRAGGEGGPRRGAGDPRAACSQPIGTILSLLPETWRPETDDPVVVGRRIGDFIAGMTDRYAVRQYEALIGPTPIPEGF